jgi:peptide/nickel transport system permease protein
MTTPELLAADAPRIGDPGTRAAVAMPRVGAWTALRRDPMFWVGFAIVIMVVGIAILAPVLAPFDPNHQFRREGLASTGDPVGPGPKFLLGTDRTGRDYLSRLMFGARTSLTIALVANTIATLIGLVVGATAAYLGSPRIRIPLTTRHLVLPVEALLMRLTDLALSFPALLLALAVAAVLGPSIGMVILIIGAILWASLSRIVYGRVRVIRSAAFVEGARALGASSPDVLVRHILPHLVPLVVVYAALGIAATILFEATLSFLGAGVPGPTATWGTMIADHISWYATDPRLVLLPGVAIMLTVLGFSLLGDAIRDALDPRAWSERPG